MKKSTPRITNTEDVALTVGYMIAIGASFHMIYRAEDDNLELASTMTDEQVGTLNEMLTDAEVARVLQTQ